MSVKEAAGNCAIFAPGGITKPNEMFGKDVANIGLYRALLRHGNFGHVRFCMHELISPESVISALVPEGGARPHVSTASIYNLTALRDFGTLFRGKADLADLAWRRRRSVGDRSYSLVGLVHCIAPPAIREYIANAAIAPVQPWDALICTSPVVQRNLAHMFEEFGSHLSARFGGGQRKICAPMLPLLPLGVDSREFGTIGSDAALRLRGRADLAVDDDDVLVLWVGRFSYYEKAAPQPMFQALEEATRRGAQRLHFAMAGWFPAGAADRKLFEDAARLHSPSVPVHFCDGRDAEVVRRLWAAGDIFLSLVDNIQETFGLAPIEAMAAGLPIVASNWDGYRATIQNNVQGMLVDTLGAPPGMGERLLDLHIVGGYSYQQYVGAVAQHTAVDVGQAAAAIEVLSRRPDLRRSMGSSGQKRAQTVFDWSVVVPQIKELFTELAAKRLSMETFESPGAPFVENNPVKAEPFGCFQEFATGTLSSTTRLRRASGWSENAPAEFETIQLNKFMSGWRATPTERDRIYDLLEPDRDLTVDHIVSHFPASRREALHATIMWMCKLGMLEWSGKEPTIV